ncbi:hypothetical protein [Hoeflea sp. TYP-13]|uniref:hypothetical protein n=1 Tax=Hoeflea sp. TYP-13 TaxID=3230023 RepID=UPI0034C69C1A
MLRILVDFFSGIVRVLAVVCIFGGAVAGYLQAPRMDVEPWAGALIGFATGFLVASVVGGLLACCILIENHLRVLADAQVAALKKPAAEEQPAEENAIERAERIASYARQYRQQVPTPGTLPAQQPAVEAPPAEEEKADQPKTG